MALPEPDLYSLLMKLRHGGALVSSAACKPDEIDLARAQFRFFVDKDGFGYVYLPPLTQPVIA